jgi:hypothetical protein
MCSPTRLLASSHWIGRGEGNGPGARHAHESSVEIRPKPLPARRLFLLRVHYFCSLSPSYHDDLPSPEATVLPHGRESRASCGPVIHRPDP